MKKGMRRLKVLRAERDVTQGRLAKQAGMSHSRYWQVENGLGAQPSEHEKGAVARALGVRVSDIEWPSFTEAHAS